MFLRVRYLAAVRVLHPLAQARSEAGHRHHRHQAAVWVFGGWRPGDGSSAGVQQSDADGSWTLAELLQQLAAGTWIPEPGTQSQIKPQTLTSQMNRHGSVQGFRG